MPLARRSRARARAARGGAQRDHRGGAVLGADRHPLRDRRAMWDEAVLAVILAGVLDGIDGRIARLLKAQSRFGAELDSLADSLSFGIAPALVLFLWSLQRPAALRLVRRARVRDLLRAAAGAVQRADRRRGAAAQVRRLPHRACPRRSGRGWRSCRSTCGWRRARTIFRDPLLVAPWMAVDRVPDDLEPRDAELGVRCGRAATCGWY